MGASSKLELSGNDKPTKWHLLIKNVSVKICILHY